MHAGAGELFCCGKPMVRLTENTVDATREKHVPVIEKVDGGYKVFFIQSKVFLNSFRHLLSFHNAYPDGLKCSRILKPMLQSGHRSAVYLSPSGVE